MIKITNNPRAIVETGSSIVKKDEIYHIIQEVITKIEN